MFEFLAASARARFVASDVRHDMAGCRDVRRASSVSSSKGRATSPCPRPTKESHVMSTVVLLCISNVFMTVAWYGHLKYGHDWPLWKAILVSWAIALLEYCLAVPANRLGYVQFSGFQLKIIQEVITISVYIVFAIFFLKEKLAWNYLVAFTFLGVAAYFAFAFKAPGSVI